MSTDDGFDFLLEAFEKDDTDAQDTSARGEHYNSLAPELDCPEDALEEGQSIEYDFLAVAFENEDAEDTTAHQEHATPLAPEDNSPAGALHEAHSPSAAGSLFSAEDSPSLHIVPTFSPHSQYQNPPTESNSSPELAAKSKAVENQVGTAQAVFTSTAPPPTIATTQYATAQPSNLPPANNFAYNTSGAYATSSNAYSWPQPTTTWAVNYTSPTFFPIANVAPSSGKVSKGKNKVIDSVKPKSRARMGTGHLQCPCGPTFKFGREDARTRHILNCVNVPCQKQAAIILQRRAQRKAKKGKLDTQQVELNIEAVEGYLQGLQQLRTHATGNAQQHFPPSVQSAYPPMQGGQFQNQYYLPSVSAPSSGQFPFPAGPTAGPSNFPGVYNNNVPQSYGPQFPFQSYPTGYYPQAFGPVPARRLPPDVPGSYENPIEVDDDEPTSNAFTIPDRPLVPTEGATAGPSIFAGAYDNPAGEAQDQTEDDLYGDSLEGEQTREGLPGHPEDLDVDLFGKEQWDDTPADDDAYN